MNNADYRNKKTFNKPNNRSSSNYKFNKFQNHDKGEDLYTPKTYPKKNKTSKFDAILESLEMPEYIGVKQQANEKRQRDLKYKNKYRR